MVALLRFVGQQMNPGRGRALHTEQQPVGAQDDAPLSPRAFAAPGFDELRQMFTGRFVVGPERERKRFATQADFRVGAEVPGRDFHAQRLRRAAIGDRGGCGKQTLLARVPATRQALKVGTKALVAADHVAWDVVNVAAGAKRDIGILQCRAVEMRLEHDRADADRAPNQQRSMRAQCPQPRPHVRMLMPRMTTEQGFAYRVIGAADVRAFGGRPYCAAAAFWALKRSARMPSATWNESSIAWSALRRGSQCVW